MPIKGQGWEFHIIRREEQETPSHERRTVGTYKVYHDGVRKIGSGLSGMVAESEGPGANAPEGNGKRVEAGRYPMATQDGTAFKTYGYVENDDPNGFPQPGLELTDTGDRTEILIHPGQGFLFSVGCINPCTNLPNANEPIDYVGSRRRVLAIIKDMKAFVGADFPEANGKQIPKAFVVIDGEPPPAF